MQLLTNRPIWHGLDVLRALAILMVFFFHYGILSGGEPSWLPELASFGWTGVDLFFVLSGFLIASQLFQQVQNSGRFSYKQFFIKRVFRILPAYFFVLLLYVGIPFFREKEALPPLWKFLTFTQNFQLNLKDQGTFSHAWSLCVEEHFYFLFPLLLLILIAIKKIKQGYWLLLFFFCLGFLLRHLIYQYAYAPKQTDEISWMYWYKFIYYPTYNRLDGLLMGVGLAAFVQFTPQYWQRIAAYGNLLLLSSLGVLTAAYFLVEDQSTYTASVFAYPIIALGYGLMVAAAVSPTCFLYKLKSPIVTTLASISYALYLSHKGVIHLLQLAFKDSTKIHSNELLGLSLFACCVAAYLIYQCIEISFLRWRKKIVAESTKPTT